MDMNEMNEVTRDFDKMYWKPDESGVPGQLIKPVEAEAEAVKILIRAKVCSDDLFQELLHRFLEDLLTDGETAMANKRKLLVFRYYGLRTKIKKLFGAYMKGEN